MPKIFTQRGYPLSEVISTLQKEIRRGNEESALYWCFEAIPGYEQYVWRRLLVIVNEDIGIANPPLLQIIPSLRAQFFEFRELGKNGTCRLILANAIALMCRSPKSRLADHFQRVVSQAYMTGPRREIPDYALDKHTGRGKSLRRGVDHWLTEGCRLEPPAEVPDPYKEEAEAHWRAGRVDAPEWGKRLANGKLVDETVVMVDDDVYEVRTPVGEITKSHTIRDPRAIAQILENAETMARGLGTPVFGFDQTGGDVRKFKPHDPLRLNSWTGGVIGIIGRALRYDTTLLLRADIDYCLKAMLKYRVVCIDTRYSFVHKRFKNRGGNDHVRSSERNAVEIERLLDRWGPWLAIEQAKTTVKLKVKVRRRQ